jgi:hypothetical protein
MRPSRSKKDNDSPLASMICLLHTLTSLDLTKSLLVLHLDYFMYLFYSFKLSILIQHMYFDETSDIRCCLYLEWSESLLSLFFLFIIQTTFRFFARLYSCNWYVISMYVG